MPCLIINALLKFFHEGLLHYNLCTSQYHARNVLVDKVAMLEWLWNISGDYLCEKLSQKAILWEGFIVSTLKHFSNLFLIRLLSLGLYWILKECSYFCRYVASKLDGPWEMMLGYACFHPLKSLLSYPFVCIISPFVTKHLAFLSSPLLPLTYITRF